MPDRDLNSKTRNGLLARFIVPLAFLCATVAQAGTVNVDVIISNAGAPEAGTLGDVRWILEEDATYDIDPNNPPADRFDSAAFQLHKSYMPVAMTGTSTTGPSFTIENVDESKRYYLSVLPNLGSSECGSGGGGPDCYTMSGAPVRFDGSDPMVANARVVVTPQPMPMAQARIRVFDDRGLINNWPDPGEGGLGDFVVFIYDAGGGPLVTNNCGHPLGTTYDLTSDPLTCDDVLALGDGALHTINESEVGDPVKNPLGLAVGELQIQNLAPGKYGIRVVGPAGEGWQQTTTIEGTPGIDVWIRAGEPTFAVEFGPTLTQAFFGMVKEFTSFDSVGGNTVSGAVTNLRMQRPPNGVFLPGQELGNCWVALNDSNGTGRYAAACPDSGSSFSIPNVPDGTYNLIVWDRYQLNIINFNTVIVDGAPVDIPLGAIAVPRWFASHTHYVYEDIDGNGIRNEVDGVLEPGIPEQAINVRFRDGSIYVASATDVDGFLPLEEIFPFFSWLVAEVDFARFKATGVRITVDDGGTVVGDPDNVLDAGNGVRTPQVQANMGLQRVETITQAQCDANGALDCEAIGAPPLVEGYNAFAGTDHKFEWGKTRYQPGENGGISGVAYYQTTRAENDPRFAAPEPWEPGIPRVQVNLYRAIADTDLGGYIYDENESGAIELADIDNYPFGWSDGGPMGPEDVNKNSLPADSLACADPLVLSCVFDEGDALEFAHTDSWDDSLPEDCVGDTLTPGTSAEGRCYDALRNWSQVRPAVFDGGFGLGAPWDGTTNYLDSGPYIVEAAAPAGYEHQDEQSKNVDFGDTFIPQALPPICVGDPEHTGGQQPANMVGATLDLFGGVDVDPRYTGARPFCNMKLVLVTDSKNTAADFFFYTEVPVSGHIQGNVLNDIGNATREDDVNFGEKIAASNIPISIRDYAGNEVNRLYTDADGRYNGLVPSTYRINAPMPTGVSPNMVRICLNPPTMPDPDDPSVQIDDPYHNSQYSQNCYTFNFGVGQTTYLDTPVLPVGAFVDTPDWQLDCNYPTETPVIARVDSDSAVGGPVVAVGNTLTIHSAGMVNVADPALPRSATVLRDFSFGTTAGQVYLNGELLTATWGADQITAVIPGGASTGQLEIVRGDSGLRTVHGLTVIVMADPSAAHVVVNTPDPDDGEIQAAVDLAAPGDVVLVPPGVYYETVIVTKAIQLQGYGAGATLINAGRAANQAQLIRWREEANQRVNCPASPADQIGLLPGQMNNVEGYTTAPNCGFRPATGLFAAEEMAGIFVAPADGAFGGATARIDGFTVTSADYSGGIIVNGYATNLEISNNIVRNNQGLSAGGIRVGQANLFDNSGEVVDSGNDNISIHHNYVSQNSSTFENGGGLGLYNGANNYNVSSNYICGNFSQGDGAGIAHYGRSPGGVIDGNQILFNQSFDQTAAKRGGNGGGIFVSGAVQDGAAAIQLTGGSGSVKITGNNIQGNQAGTGDGGAIALQSINGQDLLLSVAANRDSVEILNNTITNNLAGFAGAISLQDAVNVSIIHNTIVNNDSTATVAAAFGVDPNATEPQPAGVISRAHSNELLALGAGQRGDDDFSNPLLDSNIILGNRSMYWMAGTGLLVADPVFWDLQVLGIAGSFAPSGNILTSEDPRNAAYGGNTLTSVATEDALLLTPYVNGVSGTAAPFNVADFNVALLVGAALDEGGNFLSVVSGPLSPSGDYHLEAGSSAIDAASIENMHGLASLFSDIDGDSRPVYGASALLPDIGADEVAAASSPPELAPEIISMPSLLVQNGNPYEYQVVAVDANQAGGFTYDVQRCNNSYNNCNQNLETAQISGAGLFTWTPASGAPRNYRITVCDIGSLCDVQDFRLDPYNSNPPIARHDPQANGNGFIESSVMGQFVWGAPGVLRNDTTGNNNQPEVLTPTIDDTSGLPLGSDIVLGANGAVLFTPPDSWTGTTTFTYYVNDGVNPADSNSATVSLRRRAIIDSATFTDSPGTSNDSWTITGYGGNFGANENGNMRVSVYLVPPEGGEGGVVPIYIGSSALFPRAGGSWSLMNVPGPAPTGGGTLTVRVANNNPNNPNNPNGALLLQGVVPSIGYAGAGGTTSTTVFVQCPGDDDGNGIYSPAEQALHPDIWCKHLAAGDGFIQTADGDEIYTFGFSDVSDKLPTEAIATGLLNAQFPAPSLVFDEGQQAYLTLTNVGTILRPDLFDPHTVHFHGFPNASSLFDGVPESSISINGGFSLTYYYNISDPGTFMYHCHVEASEHMQMGMLGNLYVNPAQNGDLIDGRTTFVYNDVDGSTGYDIEKAIQIGSMDWNYHSEHLLVQPLPFAGMHDDYPMLNGRGYPDTVGGDVPASPSKADAGVTSSTTSSQQYDSLITATVGDRILLRISNLNVTQFNTLATTGLTMKVVGTGAHILRGPGSATDGSDDLYYETSSVTLGGGEALDVLIDTTGVAPGTYFLYSTNLDLLSNGDEDFGGMMTEIVINP